MVRKIKLYFIEHHANFIGILLIICLFILLRQYSFLLFHTTIELISIAVSIAIFMFAWNSRYYADHSFLLFLGISFLPVGILDLFHTLAYKGMNIFVGYDANLPTQFWIAARYLQSISFVAALYFIQHKFKPKLILYCYLLITSVIIILIFYRLFPDCYIEGSGLTQFKVISEYIISFLFFTFSFFIFHYRSLFDKKIFQLLITASLLTVFSELAFTRYIGVYDLSNVVGHYFKLYATIALYQATIEIGLKEPYKLLYRNLHQSEEKFRTLVESTAAGIIIWKTDQIIYTNPAAEKITGYDLTELQQRGLKSLILPQDNNEAETFIKQLYDENLENNSISNREMSILTKENKSKQILFSIGIVRINDTRHYIATFTDISEQKRLEKALLQSNQELENFAYVASHDLQEPLRKVKSYIEILEKRYKDQFDENAKAILINVSRSAERMQRMIKDLLEYSRITRTEANFEPISLENVLQQVLLDLNLTIQLKNAHITHDPLPAVKGQPTLLYRLLLNLLTNALKFQKPGIEPQIHIGVEKDDTHWIFSVQDNGMGIDQNDQERVFFLFTRLHSNSAIDGTGIGLAVCKRIVEMHGGKIWLASEPNVGSTFYFSLPA